MAVTTPEYTPEPAPAMQPAEPPKKRPTALIVAAIVGALVVLAAGITAAVFASRPTGPDPKDPLSAIPACREQVKARMRAPATTQFPGGEMVGSNSNQPQIDGVYDSQNGFGALMRGTYTCLLSHDDAGNVQVASVTVRE